MEIKGDFIMEKDEIIEGYLIVDGCIYGRNGNRHNLIVEGNISARDISAWDISAGHISARDISAGNISASGNISAWNISARDISAWNISARDISAWDISAGNISARDISAGGSISAIDIRYHAVCFAYRDISCQRTIKGKMKNSRHFVLDGKISEKKESECKLNEVVNKQHDNNLIIYTIDELHKLKGKDYNEALSQWRNHNERCWQEARRQMRIINQKIRYYKGRDKADSRNGLEVKNV